MDAPTEYRFYGDLARWWPLISPPDQYAEEATFVASLLQRGSLPVRTVLELGSGGGHVAFYLKESFDLTLVDLSTEMLDVSRRLNPECEHIQGDMRTVRLERLFDAILIYDAIDYMTTESDLTRAIKTAFAHCNPGGVALLVPDHIGETFEPGTDHGGYDDSDGRGARYLEWSTDPDPDDTEIRTEYAFLLRDADGVARVVHETHHTGLFARDTWLRLLGEVGFQPDTVVEETTEDRPARELFIAYRPKPGQPRGSANSRNSKSPGD